jgi:uncharacterized membrane protein YfcA
MRSGGTGSVFPPHAGRAIVFVAKTGESALGNGHKTHRRRWRIFAPVVLIIIGVVLLLEQTGVIAPHTLSRWWPLLLILVGVWLLVDRYNR